jgi:transposase
MKVMKFAHLTDEQASALQVLHKSGKSHRERQRAQAVLLSARGMSLDQLAFVFECDRDTVSNWLNDWQSGGVTALSDAAKSGRPPSLDATAQSVVLQVVSSATPNFKGVLQDELKKGA